MMFKRSNVWWCKA